MRASKSQAGLSIIEIVISLFIVGMVLLVYQAALNTLRLNRGVRFQEVALRIASTKIEDLRATAYGSLPTTGSFSNVNLSQLPSGQAQLTMNAYNDSTKEAIVTVSWQEPGSNNTRSVTLTTLLNETGL